MRRRQQTLSDKLRPKQAEFRNTAKHAIKSINELEEEVRRLARIMRDTPQIIDKLNREFEESTSLTNFDVKFLFIATALQCLRQYIFFK